MKILAVLFSLFSLQACATFSDIYTYFGLSVPLNVDGTLKARSTQGGVKNDEPLYTCAAQGSCIVVKSDEFFKIQADYDSLAIQLKACQQGQ